VTPGSTGTVMRKSVVVPRSPEDAFRLYTEGIATWWPLRTHSVAEEDALTVAVECRAGGRLYEVTRSGEEHVWGTIAVWEPPGRLVYTWHPGRSEDTAQRVAMRFDAEGDQTRVSIEHTGWERLGDRAAEQIPSYDGGWDYVLGECFASAGRKP
jgi:uncharacterized protein YndB with AHSA1/START domain